MILGDTTLALVTSDYLVGLVSESMGVGDHMYGRAALLQVELNEVCKCMRVCARALVHVLYGGIDLTTAGV